MNPGRELDALVAEKVMGWWWGDDESPAGAGWYEHDDPKRARDWSPSQNIADAWEVVEKLVADGFSPDLLHMPHQPESSWTCHIDNSLGDTKTYIGIPVAACSGKTVPHAICLAALKAVGAL